MAVQNQNVATIQRETVKPPFVYINLNSIALASARLNGNAFKVWLYLARNQDDLEWEISPKAIHQEWGIPISSVQKSITELKEQQYLVPREDKGSNQYYFYEISPLDTKEEKIKVMRAPGQPISASNKFVF